jgi:ABC-type methionine transport system permease subunit
MSPVLMPIRERSGTGLILSSRNVSFITIVTVIILILPVALVQSLGNFFAKKTSH